MAVVLTRTQLAAAMISTAAQEAEFKCNFGGKCEFETEIIAAPGHGTYKMD